MFYGFDIETGSHKPAGALRPQIGGGWINTLVTATTDGRGQALFRPTPRQIIEVLHSVPKGGNMAVWKGTFDLAWLLSVGVPLDLLCQYRWYDGLLLYKRFDLMEKAAAKVRGFYGLKPAAYRFFGDEHYSKGVTFDVPADATVTHPEVQKLLAYNAKDSAYTASLAEYFYNTLSPVERTAADYDAEILPDVASSWVTGQPIDTKELRDVAYKSAAQMQDSLTELGLPATTLNSPDKLRELLFTTWGITPLRKTDGGKSGNQKDSTDKYTMIQLARSDPRVQKVYLYRQARGRWGKFIQGSVDAMKSNGTQRSFSEPVLAGTYTGRWTYSSTVDFTDAKGVNREIRQGVAWHQIERGKMIRSIYTALPGYMLAEFDASQQEARLMADYSCDTTMCGVFNSGKDIHSYTGSRILGCDYSVFVFNYKSGDPQAKHYRNLGKFVNLAIQYRAGDNALLDQAVENYQLFLTKQEIKRLKQAYLSSYPGVKQFWHDAPLRAMTKGYAETRGGRRVALREWVGDSHYKSSQTAINFPIQGTGADIAAKALATLKHFLRSNKILFAWGLHDGLYFHLPQSEALPLALAMKQQLNNMTYDEWNWQPLVALPWDGKLGPRWGDMKDV